MRRRKGLCGPRSENCLLFALPSHCQRHHQRGPWYPAERPPRVCGISVLLWAPRRPVSHTRRVSGGVGARVLVDSIPLGPSPQPKGHRKGDPLGVSTLVPEPASWMDLKMWSPALEAWESGREPGVSTSRVSWALFQDPRVFEGPRSLQGRPGMTEPHAVAPPPRSGSKSVAEFPHRGRAPSSGSPGTGKRG